MRVSWAPTLFARSDEVEAAWAVVDPLLEHWSRHTETPCTYEAGTWGPPEADALLARERRYWSDGRNAR
jgi:glucose-6-phosphate 1-dehydrogenase